MHVFGYVKGSLGGHCSAECVDSSIIQMPKGFNINVPMGWSENFILKIVYGGSLLN